MKDQMERFRLTCSPKIMPTPSCSQPVTGLQRLCIMEIDANTDVPKPRRFVAMQESPYVEYRDGVYRVAGTRVALDSIVRRFWDGDAPESIVQSFPVLTLEQVYGTIAYYLHHQACIDVYLKQAEAEEAAMIEQLHHQNQTLHKRLVRLKSERVQTHES